MLKFKLTGRLGNQMFPYAAVRSLAEARGCGYTYRPGSRAALRAAFELGGESAWDRYTARWRWRLKPQSAKTPYTPAHNHDDQGYRWEIFDPAFFDIPDWSDIIGGFFSDRYFIEHREKVIRWFTPHVKFRRRIDEIDRSLPMPPEQRCCIHIRRTDYFQRQRGFGTDTGSVLPMEYYEQALKLLDPDLLYVIISDDPDFAQGAFTNLKHRYVSRGEHAVVDMFLMTRCRCSIIANSSYSWWGAWLNQTPDKQVIGPLHHIGWTRGFWRPEGIRVEGWQYIDVANAAGIEINPAPAGETARTS